MHSFFHERIQSEIPSLHQMKCQLITRLYNERSLFWEFIRPTYRIEQFSINHLDEFSTTGSVAERSKALV